LVTGHSSSGGRALSFEISVGKQLKVAVVLVLFFVLPCLHYDLNDEIMMKHLLVPRHLKPPKVGSS